MWYFVIDNTIFGVMDYYEGIQLLLRVILKL